MKGLILSMSGSATKTANGISLLFDQKKLLNLIKTIGSLKGNSTPVSYTHLVWIAMAIELTFRGILFLVGSNLTASLCQELSLIHISSRNLHAYHRNYWR